MDARLEVSTADGWIGFILGSFGIAPSPGRSLGPKRGAGGATVGGGGAGCSGAGAFDCADIGGVGGTKDEAREVTEVLREEGEEEVTEVAGESLSLRRVGVEAFDAVWPTLTRPFARASAVFVRVEEAMYMDGTE